MFLAGNGTRRKDGRGGFARGNIPNGVEGNRRPILTLELVSSEALGTEDCYHVRDHVV